MCCKQSVVTALDDLERLGFVTRIRRNRRIMTPLTADHGECGRPRSCR
jgi:hypothetical protein